MSMESCSLFAGLFDALDLWVILPFLLGYFSWKFLFMDVTIPAGSHVKKIVDEPTSPASNSDDEDNEQREQVEPGDVLTELERLREEIRMERAQSDNRQSRVLEKRSRIGGHPSC
eukprot:gnl/MRDRNA2_/MRDRNA2_121277_c0_seq1.p1 gnl/MRDRNA2_/MRDRNA2_121277_c0~~gnl/MRDRNA2_/MRDRNA2_121277_c0_seq1.p1  ORF type:complete len:115 (-),score=19.35 gnl/MRDRNA2_/MRDRNA2_121277_c0_seq1:268-612(-)